MKINTVELKNIGPHKDLKVDLSAGLIGLLGANGSGKSTLVNAIYAALTNDFSRFSNIKADIITNDSGKQASFIRVVGSHHGQDFELTRWLRPNKNELVIGGDTYTKATDVNEAIQANLGISKLVIDKYVFVDQWEMFQFLSQTDGERAKTFQYLCGTESATKIHKLCGEYVTKQKGVEIVDNSLELEEAIAVTQEQMDTHAEEGREAKGLIMGDEKLASHEDLIKRAEKADDAEKLVEDSQNLVYASEVTRKKLDVERVRVVKELKDKTAKFSLISIEKLDDAHELIENWDNFKRLDDDLELLVKNLASCEARLKKIEDNKPVKDNERYVTLDERDELVEQKGELLFQLKQDRPVVEEFGDEDITHECSKCHQPVDTYYIQNLKANYETNQEQLADVVGALKYSTDFDASEKLYWTQRSTRKDAVDDVISEISEVNVALSKVPGTEAYDKAVAFIVEFKTIKREINQCEELKASLDVDVSKIEGQIESTEKYLEGLRETVTNQPATELVVRSKKRIDVHNQAVIDHGVAIRCFKNSKRNRTQLRLTLVQLRFRLKEKAKIRDLLSTISEAGDVFHWNNLPKTVSQANLELLVDDINENLVMFNNPYYVEADQDLTFKVYFPGVSPVKATQLSGGQKVVLAIAFRAALDRVFGHDIGMMFLDEPTAGLDSDNVEYFHDALQQLSQKVHGDRQLVVITHVQELGGVFDQLIQL